MGEKILIVEDDKDTLQAISVMLRGHDFEVVAATDGYTAVRIAQKENPSLILLDLGLPGGDGMTVLERLKSLAAAQSIPVVVLTARDAKTWRDKALAAGASAFLSKPFDNKLLLSTIRELLEKFRVRASGDTPAKTIMLVEDDADTRLALSLRLKAKGYRVVMAGDAISAMSVAAKEKPDLIILDLGLPGGDGFILIGRFKANDQTVLVPIIVLSARDPATHRDKALKAGALAFFNKPPNNEALLEAIRRALGQ